MEHLIQRALSNSRYGFYSGIGDTKLDVLGLGDIAVTVEVNQKASSKILTEVLYVPGLGVNLFSIGAATASGLIACFEDDKVIFFSPLDIQTEY